MVRSLWETYMAEDLDNTIEENAASPAKASGDSGSVEQHKLTDQIEADKYLASKAASRRSGWPLRLFKLSAPGAR